MKIMQIIPALGMGGAEKVLEHLVRNQKENGDSISVVTFYDETSPVSAAIKTMGIETICLNKKLGVDFTLIRKLKRIIKERAPDVIHTHLYAIPYVFLSAGKTPIIHTVHSIAQKEQDGRTRPLCRCIYNSNRCTVVAINAYVKESLEQEYRMKADKVEVVLNGVPLNRCIEKKSYDFGNVIEVINVASLIPLKNHKIMIDAVCLLNEKGTRVRLTCVGGGVCKDELEQYAVEKKVQDQVIFVGILPDVFSRLNRSDIFILPSQYEGVPMSLIEAMGTGLPSIVTNNGGTVDMIRNYATGILISPTAEALSDAILELEEKIELRKELGVAAKNASIKYSDIQMAKNYNTIYGKAIARKRDRAEGAM